MPVRKGESWGHAAPLPAGGTLVRSDAEARAIVTECRRAGRQMPVLGLLGGDLCRTLGGIGDERRLHSPSAMTYEVDLGAVLADGRLHWFVAHLVARTRWWSHAFVAMNAAWLGPWNAGPKAHPGDGVLDCSSADLGWSDRRKVRARLPLGAHLPHPGIRVQRTAAVQHDLPRSTGVWLDGERALEARTLAIRVEPAALTVVV